MMNLVLYIPCTFMSQIFPICTFCFRINPYTVQSTKQVIYLRQEIADIKWSKPKSKRHWQKDMRLHWSHSLRKELNHHGQLSHHIIPSLPGTRTDQQPPNRTQTFLIQRGIPAATLQPVGLPHIEVQEYIWSKQNSRNAYGVATEEPSKPAMCKLSRWVRAHSQKIMLLPTSLQHHKSLK